MNHTLAYAPKSEAFIKKANAFLTYTTGRVLVKFNVEGLEFYAVAKKGEKLEIVFEREVVTRGGEVVKKYYPEFNAWQIEYIKIGNKVLDKNIHFFMKNGIPMVSNGEKIEFPNASEITIDGNATEFNFKRVDFQVNPTNMQQMGELYQGGIEISQGAREIMNGQRSREQIACAHGETRTHTIEANGNNMVAINHETGEITSVAEINSEKRVQPIKEEKIILQPIYQEQNYEAFGRIEIPSQYQNIIGLNRDAVNERRQIEERADTLEFGGLRVANDNAQYKVEIVQENGYGRIKISQDAQYSRAQVPTQKLEARQIQRTYEEQPQEPRIIQIPQAKVKQKKPKTVRINKSPQETGSPLLHRVKSIDKRRCNVAQKIKVPKEKGVLLKVNYTKSKKAQESEINPQEIKGTKKAQQIRKIKSAQNEEKRQKEKMELVITRNKRITQKGKKPIKIEELEESKYKKEEKTKKMKTPLEKIKTYKSKTQIQKIQINENTQKKAKITKSRGKNKIDERQKNHKMRIQEIGGKNESQKIKENENKKKEDRKIMEVKNKNGENKEKKDREKSRKIKKYFFNELLGLFTKRRKVNKLKKVV